MAGNGINTPEEVLNRVEIDPNSGCWLWRGCLDSHGYGLIRRGRKGVLAHRWSYAIYRGAPEGRVLRHSCDTPVCVNPSHLVPGTYSENMQDAYDRGRKVQRVGHQSASATHTDEHARQVLRLLQEGKTTKDVMVVTGLDRDFINRIKFKRAWLHIHQAG